jgi:hypothetical protein
LLGKKLMALSAGHTLIEKLTPHAFGVLLTAIGKSVDKLFPTLHDAPDLDALTKKVGSALSRRTRGLLTELVTHYATAPTIDLAAYLEAIPFTEARAGLVVSAAFDAAIRLTAREQNLMLGGDAESLVTSIEANPLLVDLLSYALSDDHFMARQALRFAIDA